MSASLSPSPHQATPPEVRPLEGVGPCAALTHEGLLWLGISAVALFARVWALGHAPLNNAEAALALQALEVAHGDPVAVANPLFSALQAIILSLFGATDATARLVPALAGVALCLLPFTLRRELGPVRALALGGLLALSPTLWFVARQSDGALLAWMLAFGSWCAWLAGARTIGWLLAGFLLACGADAVTPALVTVGALAAGNAVDRLQASTTDMLVAGGACLIGATAFGLRLAGLGDMFNGYAVWFARMTQAEAGQLTVLRGTAGLLVSEPLILLGALVGAAVIVWNRRRPRDPSAPSRLAQRVEPWLAWAGMGYGLYAITQARAADGFVPVILGCGALAAVAIEVAVGKLADRQLWAMIGAVAGVSLIMLVYGYMGFLLYAGEGQSTWLLAAVIALLMVGGITIVATLTLSAQVAVTGVGMAAAICLALYTLSAGVQLTQTRADNPAEPYITQATLPGLDELRKVLAEVSSRANGDPTTLSIELPDSAPPSLRWAVRDWPKASFVPQPGAAEALLTPVGANIDTSGAYIGSEFGVASSALIRSAGCDDRSGQFSCFPLARWLAFRTLDGAADTANRTVRWVLWLRQDLALKYSGQ